MREKETYAKPEYTVSPPHPVVRSTICYAVKSPLGQVTSDKADSSSSSGWHQRPERGPALTDTWSPSQRRQ